VERRGWNCARFHTRKRMPASNAGQRHPTGMGGFRTAKAAQRL